MNPSLFNDYQLRLREQQRRSLLSWIVQRSAEPGVVTGQTLSDGFLDGQLQPAQSVVSAVLDEASGERLNLTIHPNGSIVLELVLHAFSELDAVFIDTVLPELSEIISDLFHSDVLLFAHSIKQIDSQIVLKAVTSQVPGRELTQVAAETLALHEILLEYVHVRLTGWSDHD
jgi:hypothetical protein